MNVIHALQPLKPSLFLAGPTPRDDNTISWRKEALDILKDFRDCTVYIPEAAAWASHDNYEAQIHWELLALNTATRVVFWIPRDLESMPAFTTNVEFGHFVTSGKCVLGYPKDAPKMKYLHFLADKHHVPIFHTLKDTLVAAWSLALRDVAIASGI